MSMVDLDRRLTAIRPSERQVSLQEREFYAFVHFTVNTFTDREWEQAAEGRVIGYKRIVRLNAAETDALRIRITDARTAPTIRFIGVYA